MIETNVEHSPAIDQRSFRDQLTFSFGFAVSRERDLLRRILKEHVTDDAREVLAKSGTSDALQLPVHTT